MAKRTAQRSAAGKSTSPDKITASDIESFLSDLGLVIRTAGSRDDFLIKSPVAVDEARAHGISFLNVANPALLDELRGHSALLLLCPPHENGDNDPPPGGRWIYCSNPRLAFALTLQRFFEPPAISGVHDTAIIHPTAKIDADVSIAPYAVIEAGVEIGARSVIGAHTVIHKGVSIGEHGIIGAGSCLGGPGFGFERDGKGHPRAMPQLGRLIIEDHVWIGENVTINRAALTRTHIGHHVKIDDHVYIAHNVRIGKAVILMAGVRIMGSARVGAMSELNPGAMIGQGVSIGQGAMIAMGACVLEDVPPNGFAAGVPAKLLPRSNKERT